MYRINLDETSVCVGITQQPGCVMPRRRGLGCRRRRLVTSRALRRSNFTWVALICDDPILQRKLPQIIVGTTKLFPNREWERLWNEAPDFIYLTRQEKAWNNREVMIALAGLLETKCIAHDPLACYIIYWDCASCYLHPEVVRAFISRGFPVIMIPALCTWLLQPLDVYLFKDLKKCSRTSNVVCAARKGELL